jgi:hypothetical protein
MALLPKHTTGQFAREKSAFFVWLMAVIAVSIFLLLRAVLGREKAYDFLATLVSRIFGNFRAKR